MQLNNYLQANGGARLLTWELFQTGPLHQPSWTAIAYSQYRSMPFDRRKPIAHQSPQYAASSTAAPTAPARAPSRRRLPARHLQPSSLTVGPGDTHDGSNGECRSVPSVFSRSSLSPLSIPPLSSLPGSVPIQPPMIIDSAPDLVSLLDTSSYVTRRFRPCNLRQTLSSLYLSDVNPRRTLYCCTSSSVTYSCTPVV